MTGTPSEWRESGVRIVRHGEFDPNTPQTPGMHRVLPQDSRSGAPDQHGHCPVPLLSASTAQHACHLDVTQSRLDQA